MRDGAQRTEAFGQHARSAQGNDAFRQYAGSAQRTETFTERAGVIADTLIDSAILVADQATWVGPALHWRNDALAVEDRTGDVTLYDGSAGIALAAWTVGVSLHRDDLLEVALQAARHAVSNAERIRAPGLYDGLAGVGLAGLRVGLSSDSTDLVRSASEILSQLRKRLPDRSDLIGGVAGIGIAFLRAAELTGDGQWLEAAVSAAERLVQLADCRPWGWAWPNEPEDPGLCGLAHGSAGCAWLLAEVARACGEPERFEEAIAGALQFERSWFDPHTNSWPDLRPEAGPDSAQEPTRPALWCHGSVGIGSSRLALDGCRPHPGLKAEVAAALQSSCASAVKQVKTGCLDQGFTICHGLAGTVDFLIDAHLHFGEPVHLDAARWIVGRALESLGDDTESWPGGVMGRPGPGLLNGLAGAMSVLARLGDPKSVPSVVQLVVA